MQEGVQGRIPECGPRRPGLESEPCLCWEQDAPQSQQGDPAMPEDQRKAGEAGSCVRAAGGVGSLSSPALSSGLWPCGTA